MQILKYNIRHINIIAMHNIIFIVKIAIENIKKKSLLLTHLMKKLCKYVI